MRVLIATPTKTMPEATELLYTPYTQYRVVMAIASRLAGRVLARPLFRRLNAHMLAHFEYTSWKTAAHHRTNFTDKKATLR